MIPLIDGGACAIAGLSIVLSSATVGWTEQGELEVHHSEGCHELRFIQPHGVTLAEVSGKVLGASDPSYRLPPERVARIASTEDGQTIVKVWLDDLDPGDVVKLSFERVWSLPMDYTLQPADLDFAEVKLPRGARHSHAGFRDDGRWVFTDDSDTRWLVVSHPWADRDEPRIPRTTIRGLPVDEAVARVSALRAVPRAADGRQPVLGDAALQRKMVDDRGFARTMVALATDGPDTVGLARWSPGPETRPSPGAPEAVAVRGPDGVRLITHPGLPLPAGTVHTPWGIETIEATAATPPVADPPTWTAHLDVELPPRPTDALTPRGGARLRVTVTARWTATDVPHMAFLPLPHGASPEEVEVVGEGRVRTTESGAWIVLPPGTKTAAVTWVEDMTDVWGVLDLPLDAPATGRVVRADGSIDARDRMTWDDDVTWRLTRLDERELISSSDRFAWELATRVVASAYPEPAASQRVRGAREGWDLAEILPGILAERATIVDLPAQPPLLPRRLHKARQTRVITPFEGASILMLYLRQARLRADWGLAHPAGSTAAGPARWQRAVVRVTHDGETRWIDPACDACDLWTLPPELMGVDVIMAEGIVQTPSAPEEPEAAEPTPPEDPPPPPEPLPAAPDAADSP